MDTLHLLVEKSRVREKIQKSQHHKMMRTRNDPTKKGQQNAE